MTPPDPRLIRQLPIYDHERELIAAVSESPIVVVEGPTGCGKTTQLPKILHQSGIVSGRLGVTQPRRIAAVSVAWRIAAELDVELGEEVGYAIRFDDKTSDKTIVKLMTDGILLEEARTDPLFSRYGGIIVDEAHERSLNIDLTLALLHRAVQQRNDLKVIISSATIDPRQFQDFFQSANGWRDVPIVSIKARKHPIEIRYREPAQRGFEARIDNIADEIVRIHRDEEPGAILVFLTGEGMIKDVGKAVHRRRPGDDLEVVPLYGRLTREEQERVFDDLSPKRKVVLSTNIAETSITIADVRYVLDCGFAKIPRYDPNTGIQTLREEPISLASTNQRAGRAGRTAPGIVVRMYDEKWLAKRPKFTDEEILRHDLCEIVLRIIDLGVSNVEGFPLPTPPPRHKLRDALSTLHQLGAIDKDHQLTEVGRQMVPFPLSPRLARMVVEASMRHPRVVDEVLIVSAFLSARSPFLFPPGEEMEARKAHDALAQPWGDAMTAVETFRRWKNAANREAFCTRMYLDPDTMAFFEKAYDQMVDIATRIGLAHESGGAPEDVSKCIAVGFPGRLLCRIGRDFELVDGTKLGIHPSSSMFGVRPRFAVATELVRSNRVFARQVSLIDPSWIRHINEEAARRWLKDDRQSKKGERKPKVWVPNELRVNGVRLKVLRRGKAVIVDIPLASVEALKSASLDELPAEASNWRGRVSVERDHYGSALNFPSLLALLPVMPLPEGDPWPADSAPQGALLDAERNLHTIERFLKMVLEPMRPSKGKKPGWLMLVANGAEGYWFEVTQSFVEAVECSAESVHALYQSYHEEDVRREDIKLVLDRVWKVQSGVQKGLKRAKAFSRKR